MLISKLTVFNIHCRGARLCGSPLLKQSCTKSQTLFLPGHLDGSMLKRCNSIGNALELHVFFINSLRPSDTIWWHRSGSTLVQVMACCLTAPSHYLNQCWLIISKVLWHSSEGYFIRDASATIHFKLAWKLPSYNWIEISQGPMS